MPAAAPANAEETAASHRVQILILGGMKKTPLPGIEVTVRDADKKPVATAMTNMHGRAQFMLAVGVHYIGLSSPEELPYLQIPQDYRGHPIHYSRWIKVADVENEQGFSFNLADACRLTLRAVDIDTGRGIPGVVFATENALAEQWAQAIWADSLGAERIGQSLKQDSLRTDEHGNFERFVGPRPGWVFFVWTFPDEFERVKQFEEVELDTKNGTRCAEHTFKFRRKVRD